ncbi:hypothetical protein OVA24_16275 [Luteolibacter sp. SL250]|uniref:hypothetical protein n=1 Tax=Luteolibacter sp. SL250 TaxID=2995170 RepID=UPI00226DD435|nr:hypothetical protein [Luteolibacter sp. SL250]WAC18787.1 hypothetical protein OVA24_16275 [Luteolibacter sp. SL250]
MKSLLKHFLSLVITVLIVGPIFALEGVGREIGAGRVPWISGSILLSTLWALFLCIAIFAPVAATTVYLVEHKFDFRWFWEPLVLLGVLAVVTIPIVLLFFRGDLQLSLLATLSFYFPTLIYFGILRALGFQELI